MEVTDFLQEKFSWTKLKTMATCPRKAFYTYVLRRKEPPSPWLLIGRAVHEGQEFDAYSKIRGEKLAISDVLDFAVTALEEGAIEESVAVPIDPFVEEHRRQLEVFSRTGERDKINPVPGTVEAAFQLEVKVGIPGKEHKPALIEGFTDLVSQDAVTGERTAVDFKTAGRPVSNREAQGNLQLALEAMGASVPKAKIVSFVREGKQHATTKVTEEVSVSPSKVERVLRFIADQIWAFWECFKSGNWPKIAPETPVCQVCQFRQLCYPEKEVLLERFVTVEKISPAGTLPPEESEWRESKAAEMERERRTK